MLFKELWEDAVELTRLSVGHIGKRALIHTIFINDSYRILALWRIRCAARRRHIPGLNHLLRMAQTILFGVEIENGATLGKGVYFLHPVGVVIGGNAVVGDRVRFFGNNTLGTARDNGYPQVAEDVTIGAGARILGPIRIGARAVVGANAVVLQDVPEDARAFGIPAHIRGPR